MNPFLAKSFASCLEAGLRGEQKRRPREALKQLAEKLRVHPSFVSQVLLGKSHLNVEQALLAADFFGLGAEETEHFLDLLRRDRSGTPKARAYFEHRIEKRNTDRLNLKRRFQEKQSLTGEDGREGADKWLQDMAAQAWAKIPRP